MSTWQLQKAKAHFNDVVRKAKIEGPQDVTLRGKLKAVIISKTLNVTDFNFPGLTVFKHGTMNHDV